MCAVREGVCNTLTSGSPCGASMSPCNLQANQPVSWVEQAAVSSSMSLCPMSLGTGKNPWWSREQDGQGGQDKLGEPGVLQKPQ